MLVTMDAIEPYLQHASSIIELDHGDDQVPDHQQQQQQQKGNIIEIRLYGDNISQNFQGIASTFGTSFSHDNDGDNDDGHSTNTKNLDLVYFLNNERGLLACEQYTDSKEREKIYGKLLILSRGGCTFTTKMKWAQEAGARAVIFVNNDDSGTWFRAMADNSNDDITTMIPSMTVSLDDGINIIAFDETSKENGKNVKVDLIAPYRDDLLFTNNKKKSKPIHIKLHGEIVHNFIVF